MLATLTWSRRRLRRTHSLYTGHHAKPSILPRHAPHDRLHRRLEFSMGRIDVEPLAENVMRAESRKLAPDRRVMLEVSPHQDAVPFPAAGLRRLDEHEHEPLVQIGGEAAEHPLCEEAAMGRKRLEDPLVVEGLQSVAIPRTRDALSARAPRRRPSRHARRLSAT